MPGVGRQGPAGLSPRPAFPRVGAYVRQNRAVWLTIEATKLSPIRPPLVTSLRQIAYDLAKTPCNFRTEVRSAADFVARTLDH
jgi:hypothetical protein